MVRDEGKGYRMEGGHVFSWLRFVSIYLYILYIYIFVLVL